MTKNNAYVMTVRYDDKVYPIGFDKTNRWYPAENLSEATYFNTLKEAEKKHKYAPMSDIQAVELTMNFI